MKALAELIFWWLYEMVATRRPPDFIVGADNPGGAYLHRWYLTPWRRWQGDLLKRAKADPTRWNRATAVLANLIPSVYLHCFLRDDDDRALHDHPWPWVSWLLAGRYVEHTIAAGGIHMRQEYSGGTLRFHRASFAHRIELLDRNAGAWVPDSARKVPCWTLFATGPRLRRWGFHCPHAGSVDFERFTRPGAPGEVGRGCEA